MTEEERKVRGEVGMAASTINYVGRAVSYYMENELKNAQDCSVLFDCFLELVDNRLMQIDQIR